MEEKVYGSYHNHTKYSKLNHGKNTVHEMCEEAQKSGFKEFAITDHAPRHLFGICRRKIKKYITEVKAESAENFTALVGLEFNLLGRNGETDLDNLNEDRFDIKLLGFHKGGFAGIKSFFNFFLKNLFCKSEKMKEINTDAYIKALEKHHFDIITHPKEYINVNCKRLAEACVKHNCYIELNTRHFLLNLHDIKDMLETDVKFVVSTDAHKKCNVNNFKIVMQKIEEFNIPKDKIVNLNQLPNFKNKYGE